MKTEGPCRSGAHTLQNDPEGTPSNILETKFRLGAGGLGHTHPPISPQWSSHSPTITASAKKSMVLPASASPPFGNACCWAAGQRLWIVSGWREATASWRASPPCMQGLQGKAGAAEAQCLPGLHSGCPPYLIGGPTPQCLGLNDSRCVKHLRGSTSNSNIHHPRDGHSHQSLQKREPGNAFPRPPVTDPTPLQSSDLLLQEESPPLGLHPRPHPSTAGSRCRPAWHSSETTPRGLQTANKLPEANCVRSTLFFSKVVLKAPTGPTEPPECRPEQGWGMPIPGTLRPSRSSAPFSSG